MMRVVITGDDREKLQAVARKLGNLSPAMRSIGGVMVTRTQKGFSTEGRDGKWAPLAASTLAYKAKKGKTKILTFNALLGKSITSRPDDSKVAVGTSLPYGAIHQFGGAAGRGHKAKIPARPYLLLTSDDKETITQIINDYVRGK